MRIKRQSVSHIEKVPDLRGFVAPRAFRKRAPNTGGKKCTNINARLAPRRATPYGNCGAVRCERLANHSIRAILAQPCKERSRMSIRGSETAPPAVPATTTPRPKTRKPPPKVRAAIEALVTGQVKTIKAAALRVGVSREY